MLIDDVTIRVTAGKGGDGLVAFNRTMMSLGPTGGDGGNGGNVVLKGVSNLGALSQFRYNKEPSAENGKDGQPQNRAGSNGANLVIQVPVGTVAKDTATDEQYEITQIGQEIIVAKGGNGGFGNFHFRSARNTSPEKANPGEPGGSAELHLELKLIADVGFIGLPNVGKSTLLNELTNAQSKVANYQFTTLEPHLGVYYELILADIPGLIEGASAGKGLGHKFLRHVERTEILFHFVSAESEDVVADYRTVRAELGQYNPALLEKPEYVFLSKSDVIDDPEEHAEKLALLTKENPQTMALSVIDDESLAQVKKLLNTLKAQKVAVSEGEGV